MSDAQFNNTAVEQAKMREEQLAEQLAKALAIIRQKDLEILELNDRLNKEDNVINGYFS
jgi:hypothetical protein